MSRVPLEPFTTFEERFLSAARTRRDLVFVSHVFFNSGFALNIGMLNDIAEEAMLVIDGYHGFMAYSTDLSGLAGRVFYLAGGYKYAMAGEGACFMHCPPGWGPRPRDTGWYAAFGTLSNVQRGQVGYSHDGWRFMGATFDPSGLYRFNAVMRWLANKGITVEAIHDHAHSLQDSFLRLLPDSAEFLKAGMVLPLNELRRGNFLTFELTHAQQLQDALKLRRVVTDIRGDRLRIGFGLYQTVDEVHELVQRLDEGYCRVSGHRAH